MTRAWRLGTIALLTLVGCQADVEYQAEVMPNWRTSGDLVISRADFREGSCMMLVVNGDDLEPGDQPVSGIRLVHGDERSFIPVPPPARFGTNVFIHEVPLDVYECEPTQMEGESLGLEGRGTIRFDRTTGDEESGYVYGRVRFNVKVGGVRFRDTLDLDWPWPPPLFGAAASGESS